MIMDEPMQLAFCNCETVVRYKSEMRYRLSPGFTLYALIQPNGAPQGMTVTVGTGGTYNNEPVAGMVLFKQLLALNISAVVLYLSAMVYSVSFALTMIWSQPTGGLHTIGAANVALGKAVEVEVSVAASIVLVLAIMEVEIGSSSEVAMIGGNGVGVSSAGGLDSASESEIPPMTNKSEMTAIKTPPPI